ncbi:MAG: putative methylamine utilization protein MauG, partial [Gammaproteobacteria bacterium]|nr:putative methylamine utilization protein MauG [Gammaproteobacteria bacterium]
MRKGPIITAWGTLATILAVLILSHTVSAQQPSPMEPRQKEVVPPLYNPYPPGILPSDLRPEIARVRREVRGIFLQALDQWRALPPPTVTGQPPTLQGTGYEAVQVLGKLMNFDENMSPFRNRACAFCHMPYAGFSGPIPSVNLTMVAYPGSEEFRAGKRTAQRYTYSPRFPVLEFHTSDGLFVGGNFWDGRAT